MSRAITHLFFPATIRLARENSIIVPIILDLILSPEGCPETVVELSATVRLRNPYLALHSICGMAIGFFGGWSLHRSVTASEHHHRPSWCWPVAYFMFGIMNLSAFFLHCWDGDSTTYDEHVAYATVSPHVWAIDAYATGVSGTCLLLGMMNQLHPNQSKLWLQLFQASQVAGVTSVAVFYLMKSSFDGTRINLSTLLLEQWYVLPLVVVGHFWIEFLILHRGENIPALTTALTVLAMSIAVIGLGLENTMCRLKSRHDNFQWHDMFYVSSLMFLACNIAFVAILIWRRQEQQQRMSTKSNSSNIKKEI